jgi:hypothetical protein
MIQFTKFRLTDARGDVKRYEQELEYLRKQFRKKLRKGELK